MNPTQHISNNYVLGAPADWAQAAGDSAYCQPLAVTRAQTREGLPLMVSFWRPTAAELAQLQRGALVALYVYGGGMPPVWMEAHDEQAPL